MRDPEIMSALSHASQEAASSGARRASGGEAPGDPAGLAGDISCDEEVRDPALDGARLVREVAPPARTFQPELRVLPEGEIAWS